MRFLLAGWGKCYIYLRELRKRRKKIRGLEAGGGRQ